MRSRMLGTAAALATAALLVGSLSATQAAAAPTAGASGCTYTKTTLPLTPGAVFGEVQATDHHGGAAGLIKNDPALPDGLGSWKDGAASLDRAGVSYMTYNVIDQNSSGTYIVNTGVSYPTGYLRGILVLKDGKRLPGPTMTSVTEVLDITENGDITGWVRQGTSTSNPTMHIVRWNPDRPDVVTEFAIPGYPTWSTRLTDADEDGSVLYSMSTDSGSKNYIHRNGQSVELNKLAGLESTMVHAISNGRVVGRGVYGGQQVGVLWDNDGTVKILPNSQKSGKLSINKSGTIIDSGSNSATDNGIPVWQLGTYVTKIGGQGDIARTIGDDGTIGGLTVTAAGASLSPAKGNPVLWRCS